MKLDIASHRGSDDRPAVVFIHGLGMNKDIWTNPLNSKILGGQFPLKVLLKRMGPEEQLPNTLYDDLFQRDYSVIAWSQRRPAGPIDSVIPELAAVVRTAERLSRLGVVLVGHSRGGLIGRKYLFEGKGPIRGLITISTPHKGSSIAGVAKYFSPLAALINPLIPESDKGTFSYSMKRIFDFLKSNALKELLPGSDFFESLRDGPLEGVYYASLGGTSPTLFTFLNLSFPDAFEKVVPAAHCPDEIRRGGGDGLVSARSSRIPWGEEHHEFDCNHAEILFDGRAKKAVMRIIERITAS